MHHIAKANFIETSESMLSLNEVHHQTINSISIYGAAYSLGSNNETLWHTVNFLGNFVYFNYNLTGFSIIGNKYVASASISGFRLNLEVSEGKVWILSSGSNFLAIVNETTQAPIQVYDNIAALHSYDLLLKNGYINIISCNSIFGTI